jgi:Phage tail tube protein
MPLAAERTINGSHGKLYLGATWLANIQRVESRITIERREVRVAGTRRVGFKHMGVTGEGTITGLKVTSWWLKFISQYMRVSTSTVLPLTLRYVLADPENGGTEEVELVRCQFYEIPFGYQVNEILEEAVPFTFEQINIKQCLSDNWEGYIDQDGQICAAGEVTIPASS